MDIITHVNGKRVRSRADLEEAMADASTGDVVSLRLVRVVPTGTGQLGSTNRVVRVRIGGEGI